MHAGSSLRLRMDWSAVIAGAIGGAVGAGATGGFTSWRDYRHEHRCLSGAIGMVSVELDQNRERINRFGQDDVKGRLTLGDWASNKATLAEHLERRDPALWDELVRAYNKIHEARGQSGRAPTSPRTSLVLVDDFALHACPSRAVRCPSIRSSSGTARPAFRPPRSSRGL